MTPEMQQLVDFGGRAMIAGCAVVCLLVAIMFWIIGYVIGATCARWKAQEEMTALKWRVRRKLSDLLRIPGLNEDLRSNISRFEEEVRP